MSDLEYLNRAADALQKAIDAGATEEADGLFEKLLAAIDVELVERGNTAGEPALFEELLLATQIERELQAVKERARGTQ